MSFAAPISRHGFFYNGDLHVEVGDFNRHKRATLQELIALLRPDLKQSRAAAPPKDQVGHWYEAQLLHYGLPGSKVKATAKIRLLDALNAKKLAVPAWVSKLEDDLRKEYNAADKKARTEYKAAQGLGTGGSGARAESASTNRKRKQSDSAVNVNVNINFAPSAGVIPHELSSGGHQVSRVPAAKKARKTAAPTPEKKIAAKDSAKKPKEKRPIAKKTPVSKQTAGSPILSSQPAGFKAARVKKEEKSPAKIKSEKKLPTKNEPLVKSEYDLKQEPSIKNEFTPTPNPPLGLINGIYDIHCPAISDNFMTKKPLTLLLTLATPTIWGAYDFGPFSGIMQICQRPYTASPIGIPLQWRGREPGEPDDSDLEDEPRVSDPGGGSIAFLGGGRIEGTINIYGDVAFEGMRRDGPGYALRSAEDMEEESSYLADVWSRQAGYDSS